MRSDHEREKLVYRWYRLLFFTVLFSAAFLEERETSAEPLTEFESVNYTCFLQCPCPSVDLARGQRHGWLWAQKKCVCTVVSSKHEGAYMYFMNCLSKDKIGYTQHTISLSSKNISSLTLQSPRRWSSSYHEFPCCMLQPNLTAVSAFRIPTWPSLCVFCVGCDRERTGLSLKRCVLAEFFAIE